MGAKEMRPAAVLIENARIREGLIPAQFEGDSLAFLRAAMTGKIWPSREQLYAARAVLPIEHPPAITHDGRSVEEIKAEAIREYVEEQNREADDVTEKIIAHLGRLRRETPAGERARGFLTTTLQRDGELSEDDQAFIDRVVAEIEQRRPETFPHAEILPPPQPRPKYSKRRSVIIDGEADQVSAAYGDISMAYEAEHLPSHHWKAESQPSSATVLGKPVTDEMVPTLAGNGKIRWVPRPR